MEIPPQIYFRLHIALSDKGKTTQYVLKKMKNFGIEDLKVDDYYKFPGTYMVSFSLRQELNSKEVVAYKLLKICNFLARGNWYVNGPFEEPVFSFGCCLNNVNEDEPLRWAYVSIGDA